MIERHCLIYLYIYTSCRWDGRPAAAADDDVEVLSQQMVDLTSPSKPPAPKKHKDGGGDGGGDGGSASQAIEFSQ